MANSGLTVHHLQISQSERIPWLCEELEIPYNLKLHKRNPIFSPPELAALHPMKAAPVIEDSTFDTANPVLLAESGAIVEYIIHRHGNGRLALPPTHKNYADYLYWFHFANGGLQSSVGRLMTVSGVAGGPDAPKAKPMADRLARALKNVDTRVSSSTWLAGEEFTAADIMTVFSLTTTRKFMPYELTEYEGIVKYLQRVRERKGYQTAMKKGDPDSDLDELTGAKKPELFGPFKAMQLGK